MMQYLLIFLIALIPFRVLSLGEQPHHQTAFIGKKHQLDILFTFSYYGTDHFWNKLGKSLPSYNDFNKFSYLLYSEYALNEYNSILINGGYSLTYEEMNADNYCFDDVEVGYKHLFFYGEDWAFSNECIGIIPTGDKKSSGRYGSSGIEIDFLFSKYFWLSDYLSWCDFVAGYRYYSSYPSDQIIFNSALGIYLNPWLQGIVSGNLTYGLYNGKTSQNFNNIIFHPNFRLLKIHAEFNFYHWNPATFSLGGFKHIWGKNVGQGGGLFGGLWVTF